jgi:uncharacterized protein YndB with AHSA1/START domain
MTMTLTHRLDRTITIDAPPDVVFGFLTETPRWAAWWGAGSEIDARPGGRMKIRYPNGTEATGEVLEVHPPERIVFTFGYASGAVIPPGASRVTIQLETAGQATRVRLAHEYHDAQVLEQHVQGWRYQLSLFANVVSDVVFAGAAETVDAWFDAWAEPDAEARHRMLARIAAADVQFHDRYSCIDNIADLVAHIGAAQQFMPGIRMSRAGGVRQCQGTVIADFVARGADGADRGAGVNVFVFGTDGLLTSVTGFMNGSTR